MTKTIVCSGCGTDVRFSEDANDEYLAFIAKNYLCDDCENVKNSVMYKDIEKKYEDLIAEYNKIQSELQKTLILRSDNRYWYENNANYCHIPGLD